MVEAVFKVEHESNAEEVTNVHEAGTGEIGDSPMVRARKMWIKKNTEIAKRGIRDEVVEEKLSNRPYIHVNV